MLLHIIREQEKLKVKKSIVIQMLKSPTMLLPQDQVYHVSSRET